MLYTHVSFTDYTSKDPRTLLPLRNYSILFMSSHLTQYLKGDKFKMRAAQTAEQIAMDTVQMLPHSMIET
jgi:hypothetical protein